MTTTPGGPEPTPHPHHPDMRVTNPVGFDLLLSPEFRALEAAARAFGALYETRTGDRASVTFFDGSWHVHAYPRGGGCPDAFGKGVFAGSRAAQLRGHIRDRGLVHRKGFTLRDRSLFGAVSDLREEASELFDAIVDGEPLEDARREAGDVFGVLLTVAELLGMSFLDLDAECERKLRERFDGAADVVL